MNLDPQIWTTVISILATLVPAIWMLSTKIQGLHGSLDTHSAKLTQQMENVEQRIGAMSNQLQSVEIRQDNLKERVVVVETKLKSGRA